MYSANLKANWSEAIALLEYLVINYDYVHLEETSLSDNGAFLIHPSDWPKSDIDSAKRCWPAIERAGFQFVGVNGPEAINGFTPKHFDGYLNGVPCELKFMNSDTFNTHKNIINKIDKAATQNAEIVLIIISEELTIEQKELKNLQKIADRRITQRLTDPLFSKDVYLLKKAIILK
jgi:hypothetical protein